MIKMNFSHFLNYARKTTILYLRFLTVFAVLAANIADVQHTIQPAQAAGGIPESKAEQSVLSGNPEVLNAYTGSASKVLLKEKTAGNEPDLILKSSGAPAFSGSASRLAEALDYLPEGIRVFQTDPPNCATYQGEQVSLPYINELGDPPPHPFHICVDNPVGVYIHLSSFAQSQMYQASTNIRFCSYGPCIGEPEDYPVYIQAPNITVWQSDVNSWCRNVMAELETNIFLPYGEYQLDLQTNGIPFDECAGRPPYLYKYLDITPLSLGTRAKLAPEGACTMAYDPPSVGHPVRTDTGNFTHQVTDMSYPALGLPLTFERSYNVLDLSASVLGRGWTHSYNMSLTDDGQGRLIMEAPRGSQVVFEDYDEDGVYLPEAGVRALLDYDTDTYTVTLGNQIQYIFDTTGKLSGLTDSLGRLTDLTYDGNGLLSEITSPDGRQLQLEYDEVVYGSNSYRVLTAVENPADLQLEQRVTFTYTAGLDPAHLPMLTTVTGLGGESETTYEYNLDGFLTSIVDPNGHPEIENDYSATGQVMTHTVGLDEPFALDYQQLDRQTWVTQGTRSETYHFDSTGLVSFITDTLTNTVQFSYDDRFNLTNSANPFERSMQYAWNARGCAPAVITDTLGYTTTMTYGDLNNLTGLTDPMGNVTGYSYDGALLRYSEDALHNRTWYTYTTSADWPQPAGLLKETRDPEGNSTSNSYDLHGQLISMTNAESETTTYTYDLLGRRQTVTYPPGERTDWSCYDAGGRVVRSVVNANGDGGTPQTNPCDPSYVPSSDPAFDRITTTAYDLGGNLIATIDPAGLVTRTYYDNANRPYLRVRNLTYQHYSVDTPPPYSAVGLAENLMSETVYDGYRNAIAHIEWILEGSEVISHTTRTYFDDLDRVEYQVKNLSGWSIVETLPPPEYLRTISENITTRTVYDAAGNVQQMVNPDGIVTYFCYDEMNRAIKMVQNPTVPDPCSNYSPSGEADEDVIQLTEYDRNGNAIATIDPLGVVTRSYYDALNRVYLAVRNLTYQDYRVNDPPPANAFGNNENVAVKTLYDDAGRAIANQEYLVEEGQVISHTNRSYFDASGRIEAVVRNLTDWDPYLDSWPSYDPNHPDQNVRTEYEYDGGGRQIAVVEILDGQVNGERIVQRTYYDELGRVETVVRNLDYDNHPISNPSPPDYDPLRPEWNVRSDTIYDGAGFAVGQREWWAEQGIALSRTMRTYYDDLGRPELVVRNLTNWDVLNPDPPVCDREGAGTLTPENVCTTTTYDGAGRAIAVTDPLGRITRTYYEDLERIIAVVRNLTDWDVFDETWPAYDLGRPDQNVRTETTYDRSSREVNRVTVMEEGIAEGLVTTHFEYDTLGRLAAVVENYRAGMLTDPQTNVRTEYGYDKRGGRIVLKDGNGHSSFTSYDALGRLESETDALGNTWRYAYLATGQRLTVTDGESLETRFQFDGLGRQILVDYPNDADVSYTYNGLGWRLNMQDGVGLTTWEYDRLGRVQSVTDPFDGLVQYQHDALGRRVQEKYPDNKIVTYSYDPLERLVSVTDWDYQSIGYNYDNAGNLLGEELGFGVTSKYVYDGLDRLLSLANTSAEGMLSYFVYAYDAASNRTSATERVRQPGEPLDSLFADGFESGDFSFWTENLSNSDLSVTDRAALAGSYGMEVTINDDQTLFVTDETPKSERSYHARFYFDPNSITMASENSHQIFNGYMDDYGEEKVVFRLELRKVLSVYLLEAYILDEGGWLLPLTQQISDEVHAIEIEWQAAAGPPGYPGGSLALIVDGNMVSQPIFDVNNDDHRIDGVNLGTVSEPDRETNGTYCFDAFASRQAGAVGIVPKANECIAGGGKAEGYLLEGGMATALPMTGTETLAITDTLFITGTLPEIEIAALETLTVSLPLSDTIGSTILTETVEVTVTGVVSGALLLMVEGGTGEEPLFDEESTENGEQWSHEVTITYVYDPLQRLTEASYGDSRSFEYIYDSVGNTERLDVKVGPWTTTTTYVYDYANQLVTASSGYLTWYYTYNDNGSLVEVMPGPVPGVGARRYTYNDANYLIQVEVHSGAHYIPQAELQYNGLGQRLSATAHDPGGSVTTHYTLDTVWNGYPLVASTAGLSTYYLYGRGPEAEKGAIWSYYLKDGGESELRSGSVRQVANIFGVILSRSFTPWGETLEQYGEVDLAWGYFGGYLDAATGLLYVGGGQYYDPATGRFLTRQPGRINPYVPWSDPIGSSIGVLGLLLLGRRRKPGSKPTKLGGLIVLVAVLAVSASLVACGEGTGPVGTTTPSLIPPTQPPTETTAPSLTPSVTPSITPMPTQTATSTPTTCTLTSTPTSTLTNTPIPLITGPTPTPGGVANSKHWQDAANRYMRIRAWLIQNDPDAITNDPQDPNGRLKDVYLIAFYISAEFHIYVDNEIPIYKLALAALYNEYQWPTICGGNCNSVIKQINWLSNSEGWYDEVHYPDDGLLSRYRLYAPDGEALNVMYGHYQHTLAFQWGNYTKYSPLWNYIHEGGDDPWWKGEGKPYLDYSEKYQSGTYAGFVVMSSPQAYACDDVKCLGW